jgi:hypothetical protein
VHFLAAELVLELRVQVLDEVLVLHEQVELASGFQIEVDNVDLKTKRNSQHIKYFKSMSTATTPLARSTASTPLAIRAYLHST